VTVLVDAVLLALLAPVLAAAGYLALLAALSRRGGDPRPAPRGVRLEVVVPAHDEEAGVARTVASLLAVDYPRALLRVTVVADNCRDATAARAAAAGARVLVRRDPDRRGKGYALAHAFREVLAEGWAEGVCVVDADTVVSPNLLSAFAARLAAGAPAVQADYGVRNPAASSRTRLAAVAFALFHGVRSLGRERLHVSAGLRGNGMCFRASVLHRVPYDAFSEVEDVEYGIRLAEAGLRVHYAPEAEVLGEMPSAGAAARLQRTRWERGRRALRSRHAARLLREGVAARDALRLDLAADLLVPPLAFTGLAAAAGIACAAAASWVLGRPLVALFGWLAAAALLGAYVLRGWWLSGTGLEGFRALLWAPVYLAWRLALLADPRPPEVAWVRTPREEERP
jgi:1,2-diacylglycerol 3-beta-glucosyltransferase